MATITGTSGSDTLTGDDADDVIYGGAGNDRIDGGAGDNVLYAGDGDDTAFGGTDDDTIYGGTGSDRIDAGAGSNLVFGGDGADDIDIGGNDNTVFGGAGDDDITGFTSNDTVEGGDGDDTIDVGSGANSVDGGAGNDSITATAGADIIYGGAGDDTIDAGSGGNTVFGGDGNDSIVSRAGADRIDGGAGNDTISTLGGADTIVFRDGYGDDVITDFSGADFVEVKSFGIASFADVQARLTADGGDSVLTLDDGSTLRFQGKSVGSFNSGDFIIVPEPVCYAAGTLILTAEGEVAVEDLHPGDLLPTADRGLQPIRLVTETAHRFAEGPHRHKPIEIKPGALGGGLPRRRLIVSPQHRLLVGGVEVEALFGVPEVLALAKGLVGLDGVRAMSGRREVRYFGLLCDRHEVIRAEGAWSETFHPDSNALRMIGSGVRAEIERLLPRLAADPGSYGPTARRVLTRRETETLVGTLRAADTGTKRDCRISA